MSLAEITKYIAAKRECIINEKKNADRMACFIAYKTAELMAVGVNNPKAFPDNVGKAFPFIFGENVATSCGVPVSDWQRSKEQMQEYQKIQKGVR